MFKRPSLARLSSPKQALLPGRCWLWAALHALEEPRSCAAPFQGRYHGCEAGSKSPILRRFNHTQAHLKGDDPPDLDDPPAVTAELQAAALSAIAAAAAPAAAAAAAPAAEAEGACKETAPPAVLHAQAFAWDHAQPTAASALAASHLLDAARRAGVCGDFLSGAEGHRGVEAAALSGLALARAMLPLLGART